MAADSTIEVQRAIVAAVRADPALGALIGDRIFARPRWDAVFPFISFSGMLGQPWDTDDGFGWELFLTLDSWSRTDAGPLEATEIMSALGDLLHDGHLTLATQNFVSMRLDGARLLLEPDGKTAHGVQRFRVLTHG